MTRAESDSWIGAAEDKIERRYIIVISGNLR
jgi:hypothetical protein